MTHRMPVTTKQTLFRYLRVCYHVTDDMIEAALENNEQCFADLKSAVAFDSFVHFPGDRIADEMGWHDYFDMDAYDAEYGGEEDDDDA